MDQPVSELIEKALGQAAAELEPAAWGFQNRTDLVTLSGGDRVVLQRYRRRADAEQRLRVTRALREPAGRAGIPIAQIRASGLDTDPAWIIFAALPGVPVVAHPEAGPGGPRFPAMARAMGELLAAFCELPPGGLGADDLWADPGRLGAEAARWYGQIPELTDLDPRSLDPFLGRLPGLLAGRPAVLAHGDFAPVNILTVPA